MIVLFVNRIFCNVQALLLAMTFIVFFDVNINAKSLGLSGFDLINPKTGNLIINAAIISNNDGLVLNLNDFPDGLTFFYTFRHFTSAGVKKVVFLLNNQEIRTERFAPYALAGDYNGKVFPYNFAVGSYKLSAVVYFNDVQEEPVNETIFFQIENKPKISEIKLIDSQNGETFKTFISVLSNTPFQCTKYLKLENSPKYFTLTAISHHVKSIVFEYAYTAPNQREQPLKYLRTENITPYALFGDYPQGNFAGVLLQEGEYKIRATPYTKPNGQGQKGTPTNIHLNVTQSTTNSFTSNNIRDEISISPNPVVTEANLHYKPSNTGFVSIELLDLQGNLIKKIYQGESQREETLSFKFDHQGIHKGVYILRVQSEKGLKIKRVAIK